MYVHDEEADGLGVACLGMGRGCRDGVARRAWAGWDDVGWRPRTAHIPRHLAVHVQCRSSVLSPTQAFSATRSLRAEAIMHTDGLAAVDAAS